ncbi:MULTISPECIES: hypothetical protein [unclassified Streptomyces]|uniref:hypothetical protein n=1 Tax=unclassified Streptomyces TaxID=2593676 RepID=UPI0008DC798A|nr:MULTISPECIES: hypothetical protein [unclassified Streptomyces]OII69621.1 hypothetical protein BJP39_03810 [Streptomyces sp. CC77]
MPDITHPVYFIRLARSIDRTLNDLPEAEHLRRGDDISPAIQSMVGDIAHYVIEISEELETSNRHEAEIPSAHGHAERSGTAALTRCAAPLGTALAHLGQVIERLGFLHENIRHSSTKRTPTPDAVRHVLQEHLDHTGTALRTAAQHLRDHAAQISRARSVSTTTSPAHPVAPPAATNPPRGR